MVFPSSNDDCRAERGEGIKRDKEQKEKSEENVRRRNKKTYHTKNKIYITRGGRSVIMCIRGEKTKIASKYNTKRDDKRKTMLF